MLMKFNTDIRSESFTKLLALCLVIPAYIDFFVSKAPLFQFIGYLSYLIPIGFLIIHQQIDLSKKFIVYWAIFSILLIMPSIINYLSLFHRRIVINCLSYNVVGECPSIGNETCWQVIDKPHYLLPILHLQASVEHMCLVTINVLFYASCPRRYLISSVDFPSHYIENGMTPDLVVFVSLSLYIFLSLSRALSLFLSLSRSLALSLAVAILFR